jgi:hypothetical protein
MAGVNQTGNPFSKWLIVPSIAVLSLVVTTNHLVFRTEKGSVCYNPALVGTHNQSKKPVPVLILQ